ncbi:MAG: IGHMBP2 family helicase [Methanobacteriaceae archaeon]|jgi:predicted DNA helicase|nr:IGHMBP2 family helicase [Methanobacteriaceae archaeon]MDO9627540.1 IGHMBP2 family helicase [Methanobacteriaceae archaeon]
MEQEAEISFMMNEIRRLSPNKRESVGRAINNLSGKIVGKELGFNLVKYGRKKSFESEINVGDLVLISRGNPLKSDLTGTVTEKGKRFITIALENVPQWALKNVRIDLYANDITFRRMKENLNNLSFSGEKALEFLLGTEKTPSIIDINPPNSFENIPFKDIQINKSQMNAVSSAMATDDFFLIHGPFGTGKTRTLRELIRQEVKKGNKILATAESNTAVDNILDGLSMAISEEYKIEDKKRDKNKSRDDCNGEIDCVRLGHPQRASRKNIKYTLAYQVENHPLNSQINHLKDGIKKIISERDKNTKPLPGLRRGLSDTQILLNAVKKRGSRGVSPNVMISMARWIENNQKVDQNQEKIRAIEKNIVENILKKSSVVLCTNSSAGLDYLKGAKFDLSVIDESSQATIPSLLIPISKAKRFVLAGDHRQLPPTIVSQKARTLQKTLFEELIKKYPQKSTILNVQYRMNPALMEFPNHEFYNGEIKASESLNKISLNDIVSKININEIIEKNEIDRFKEVERDLLDSQIPFIFLNTSKINERFEQRIKDSTSIQNPLEADIISIIINIFLKSGFSSENIGIISPYDDQRNLISSLTNVEVKTVDGYQGREKDIMIISTVRSNSKREIGFLSDMRRLNVALTRARRKMIMVGDVDTLKSNATYHRLIKDSKKRGFLKDLQLN